MRRWLLNVASFRIAKGLAERISGLGASGLAFDASSTADLDGEALRSRRRPGRDGEEALYVCGDVIGQVDASGHVQVHSVESKRYLLSADQTRRRVGATGPVKNRAGIEKPHAGVLRGLLGADRVHCCHVGGQLGILPGGLADPEHLRTLAQ